MKLEKVVILKDGKDIGRIIPFNLCESDCDFKISFSKNSYSLYTYQFLSKKPIKHEIDNSSEWEISYHDSNTLKPAVIHLKEKKNYPEYKVLPLNQLSDPNIFCAFPIPFMKIEIPLELEAKNYKFKKETNDAIFDMGIANVAEFYLTSSIYNYEDFSNKWPSISLLLTTSSFEYFATNDLLTDHNKYNFFMPTNGEVRRFAEEFILNKDMKFYVNVYNNPEYVSGEVKVTFIENKYSQAIMGLSQVGYRNEQGIIDKRFAYLEDINRNTMPVDEQHKWKYRFQPIQNDFDKEIRKEKKLK